MDETKRTLEGAALTDLILDLFRLNSRMLASGDRLVDGLGLTSARWQILGTIVAADRPRPVAWIARDLGAARQNVHASSTIWRRKGSSPSRPTRTIGGHPWLC